MNTSEAYEAGRIFEFLTGITTAGAGLPKGFPLEESSNLHANLPINRYSVAAVVERIKRLQELLKGSGFSDATEAVDELRAGLKEMEEYMEANPSQTSFLQNPFAEKLVTNARIVEEKFHAELEAP